ncbi:MAG: hypothetical protein V7771_00005 [Shewanella psychromarinicola]|uniref:hypothetical protein n=1 Tax=Shewanella psychromarinicola TaxID=2487742 RepID=UPI00300154E4
MQHVRQGNLIAIQHDGEYHYFLVLTESAFFGCQWSYCFYKTSNGLLAEDEILKTYGNGFPALVDFIIERRANEVVKISKKVDVSSFQITSNLKARIDQYGGGHKWYIYSPGFSKIAQQGRLKPEQECLPIASGLKAKDAIRLIKTKWKIENVVTEEGRGQYPL